MISLIRQNVACYIYQYEHVLREIYKTKTNLSRQQQMLYYPLSTGKLKSINEETISETHLEIVEKTKGKRYLWAAVIKFCHILCEENTYNCSNNIIYS